MLPLSTRMLCYSKSSMQYLQEDNMLLQLLHGASENPPLSTTGTNYPLLTKKPNMLRVVATGAYYPSVASIRSIFCSKCRHYASHFENEVQNDMFKGFTLPRLIDNNTRYVRTSLKSYQFDMYNSICFVRAPNSNTEQVINEVHVQTKH